MEPLTQILIYFFIGLFAGFMSGMFLKTKPAWLEIGLSLFIVVLAIIVLVKAIY